MNDERPRDHRAALDGWMPDPGPDDFEVLLFGGDGPELTPAQAERNTELLAALTGAARDGGVMPRFLQLPAAPTAYSGPAGSPDVPPFDEATCLRMGLRTRRGFPMGRIDFLNDVLRLAAVYRLGMYVGETAASGRPEYREVLPHRGSAPDPDARPDAPRRAEPQPRARHRVIDLTVPVPVPARAPLDGSLMVTVVGPGVGPGEGGLAADLARIAVFLDCYRVGCHAASGALLDGTIVLNFVLVVLPGARVDTATFTAILARGLDGDRLWPARFRPTLLDPTTQ